MSTPARVTAEQLNPSEPTKFEMLQADDLVLEPPPLDQKALFPSSRDHTRQRHSKDHMLRVRFYRDALPDLVRYHESDGQEIVYYDCDMVEIVIPHDPRNVTVREATDHDKRRFSAQWTAYKSGQISQEQGTALEVLRLGPAQKKQLELYQVSTVEQLAEMQFSFPGFQEMKTKAKNWLMAQDSEAVKSLEQQNKDLMARLAALENVMQEKAKK